MLWRRRERERLYPRREKRYEEREGRRGSCKEFGWEDQLFIRGRVID